MLLKGMDIPLKATKLARSRNNTEENEPIGEQTSCEAGTRYSYLLLMVIGVHYYVFTIKAIGNR